MLAAGTQSVSPGTAAHPHEARRHHGLDVLRGGMMLLGVALHAAASYVPGAPFAAWPFGDPPGSALAGLMVAAIHVFRMPVFFVMAGFFGAMTLARRGARAMLADRLRRIGIPLAVGWVVLFPAVKWSVAFAWWCREGASPGDAVVGAATGVLRTPWADPSPAHLWFLWYLLPMYLAAAAAAAIAGRMDPARRRAWGDRLAGILLGTGPRARRRMRLPALVLLTWALLLPMRDPGLDTPGSWALEPRILAAYGFFFAIGWLMHAHRGVVAELEHRAWRRSFAAFVALGAAVVLAAVADPAAGGVPDAGAEPRPVAHALAQGATALAAWLTALAGIGLTERVFRAPSRAVRWVVDASYWTYLVHLPLCFAAAGLMTGLDATPVAKMLAVMAAVSAACGLSYAAVASIVPTRRPGAPAPPSAHA